MPREHRFPVRGRIGASGQELEPLDEAALEDLSTAWREEGFESIAVGFIHSYMNLDHEQRAREILGEQAQRADLDLL